MPNTVRNILGIKDKDVMTAALSITVTDTARIMSENCRVARL